MQIMVADGMGGGVGRNIVDSLKKADIAEEIIVVGTNSSATSNMMKAGATAAATGESAIIYNAAHADILIGPIGIILPNAMYGEISPAIATAIGSSPAKKILIPVQNSHAHIVGLGALSLTQHIEEAVRICAEWIQKFRLPNV